MLFSPSQVFSSEGMASGVGLRVWEMARALKRKGHAVTIAEDGHGRDYEKDGVRVLGCDWSNYASLAKGKDAVIAPQCRMMVKYFKAVKNVPILIDLYDPILMESIKSMEPDLPGLYEFSSAMKRTAAFLLGGDYFVCGNGRQLDYYTGMLSILGRINPLNKGEGLMGLVPNAAPSEKPKKPAGTVLKGKAVPAGRRIILWPGGIYPWFDAGMVIEAMARVRRESRDAALVFVGADNPGAPSFSQEGFRNAKRLAEKHGLLGTSVFFTGWLPYAKRAGMYFESDFAVATYRNHLETKFSARTRLMDCLWGGLPVVCSGGDELSEDIAAAGAGVLVGEDPKELAEKMCQLLGDRKRLAGMRRNARRLASEKYNWDAVIGPVDEFCRNPKLAEDKESALARKTLFSVYRFSRMHALKSYFWKSVSVFRRGGIRKVVEGAKKVAK